jgi:hypothetical protein
MTTPSPRFPPVGARAACVITARRGNCEDVTVIRSGLTATVDPPLLFTRLISLLKEQGRPIHQVLNFLYINVVRISYQLYCRPTFLQNNLLSLRNYQLLQCIWLIYSQVT